VLHAILAVFRSTRDLTSQMSADTIRTRLRELTSADCGNAGPAEPAAHCRKDRA